MGPDGRRAVGRTALAVSALGVVFGDIGTSPIYTIQIAFNFQLPRERTITLGAEIES